MNSKEIKKNSRKSLKKCLWNCIIVCFIVSIVIGGGYRYSTAYNVYQTGNQFIDIKHLSNLTAITNFLSFTKLNNLWLTIISYRPTNGILSSLFNSITGTGSVIIGILNILNQFIFRNSIPTLITVNISLFLYIFLFIFLYNIIIVGRSRYFLELQQKKDTQISKIFYVYNIKKVVNVALIMMIKFIKSLLWDLTIIGGLIKHYEYSVIPYLLAENPNMEIKEYFMLAKKMTYGKKMDLFKIDLSLLGWYVLGILSLGLSNVFYFRPYKESLKANLYLELRKNKSLKNYFNDDNLNPTNKEIKERKYSYKIDYSLENLVLLFFSFSFIGWIYEVLLNFMLFGEIVNKGTMYGPWLPIYGWGGVLILVLLKKFRNEPTKLFIAAFILCGIIEYTTGWYLETFKHMKWWTYEGYFINLHGRICLEGLILFGLGGCVFTYFLGPVLNYYYNKIKPNLKLALVILLIFSYLADLAYTRDHPNTVAATMNIRLISGGIHE